MRRLTPKILVVLLLANLLAVGGFAKKKRDPLDLVNIRLSPKYSQWLVGATGLIASEEELRKFSELENDSEAEAFIVGFWELRQEDKPEGTETSLRSLVGLESNPLRELFEKRAVEADKLFSEAGFLGRRTARGTVYVLFGEADENEYEVNPQPGGGPVEAWTYERGTRRGLDGSKPERLYRFVRDGDLTVEFNPHQARRPVRRRQF